MEQFYKRITLLLLFSLSFYFLSSAQTIRYQQSIRGGFALASNCLVSAPLGSTSGSGVKINTAGGTTMSSCADLILPPGSTIAKAYLYVEQFTPTPNTITSVKFRVPGGAYTTLTSASAGFIANPVSVEEAQFIIDVTAMMPAAGYLSTFTAGGNAGTTGRYAVADIATFDAGNYGCGWSLFVVYTNPASRYRNVTIADNCATFGGTGCGTGLTGPCNVTFNVNGISVPSAGTVNAVVAITGTYGDISLSDNAQFGKAGGTLSNLTDPTTGLNTDLYNSTIGICAQNNVSTDGGPAMSGNFVARNPYNTFDNPNSTTPPTWYSYFYDADILNATGILVPSATPINVTFTQKSGGGDLLGGGAYAISVDIAAALITKSLSPKSIIPGGIATYTWTIDNTVAGALNLSGIGFTDNLPASLMVANPPNASIVGGTGGTITAAAGGTSVKLAGLSLSIGQIATMTVDVTNKPGQLNPSCLTNPLAFTNGFLNVTGNTANLANGVTDQCLVVDLSVPINLLSFTALSTKGKIQLDWSTASEQNSSYFTIEKSTDLKNFSQLGNNISAAGKSSNLRSYSAEDPNPTRGINYYRLNQFDTDGKKNVIKMVAIDYNTILNNIVMSPQPATADRVELSFNSNSQGSIRMVLYDVAQREVFHQTQQFNPGGNSFDMDLSSVEKGVYLLSISNAEGSINHAMKLVKP